MPADELKTTQLTAKTDAFAGEELMDTVIDPSGTPLDRKVTHDVIFLGNNVIEAGTSFTFTLGTHDNKEVETTNAAAVSATVDTNANQAFPIGTRIRVWQSAAGQVTIVAGGGVTINTDETLLIDAQFGQIELLKVATDEWLLTGDIQQVSPLVTEAGTTFTLTLGTHDNKSVSADNASPITITVDTNANQAFRDGDIVAVRQGLAGQVTFSPAGGVTINSAAGDLKTNVQFSQAVIEYRGTDVWQLSGDITT